MIESEMTVVNGKNLPLEAQERDRLACSIEEAAERLGISRTSAYLAAQRGELPTRCIGRRRVVPLAALTRFLEEGSN